MQVENLFLSTNNGHHIVATLTDRTYGQIDKDLWVSGGGLTGQYYFVNFHVHWGADDVDHSTKSMAIDFQLKHTLFLKMVKPDN